ncbi:OsmC-like protein [compost metagenome]
MSQSSVRAVQDGIPYQVQLSAGLHQWLADESAQLGGQDSGPNPHQLLLSALGACTAITLAMYARRKEIPLKGIDVQLSILKEEGRPLVHTEIARAITLEGELDEAQRQRLLEIANVCPLHKLLSGTVQINSELT